MTPAEVRQFFRATNSPARLRCLQAYAAAMEFWREALAPERMAAGCVAVELAVIAENGLSLIRTPPDPHQP